jgi:hypothetical protein
MDIWYFYIFFSVYILLALLCFIAPIFYNRRKKKRELEYKIKIEKFKLFKKDDND